MERSEDGLTYTFTLHDDVVWHDGEPFTSEDVVFSVDEFLRETHARLRASLVHVESIEAPDDTTVVFTLKQPFGPFLGLFEAGTMPMIPKHIYEGTDYAENPANNTPIGTGPFKFEEWERGSYIHLVKNEDYYLEGKPYLDEIYYQVIPDAASRSVAFETGKVDLLPGGSVENFDIPRLTAMDNVCHTTGGWEFFAPHSWMWLNMHEGPMTDKNLRKAVMHAVNREFARDALWNGNGRIATGPVNSVTRFYEPDTPDIGYDPEKAREYLEASDYDGETLASCRCLMARRGSAGPRSPSRTSPRSASTPASSRRMSPAGTRRSANGTSTSPSPISISTAIRPSVWRELHLVQHRQGQPVEQRLGLCQRGGRRAFRESRRVGKRGRAAGALQRGAEHPCR